MVRESGNAAGVTERSDADGKIPLVSDSPGSAKPQPEAVQIDGPDAAGGDAATGAVDATATIPTGLEPAVKRGRGRPRKIPLDVTVSPADELAAAAPVKELKPKKAKKIIPEYSAPLEAKDKILAGFLVTTGGHVIGAITRDPPKENENRGPVFTGDETETLIDVWSRYFRSIGIVDLPPLFAAVAATVMVCGPKFATVEARGRIGRAIKKLKRG